MKQEPVHTPTSMAQAIPRLGALTYINALPINLGWRELDPISCARLVIDTPQHLNRLLAEGELDISPVSSIEYARHQDQYLLAGDVCLMADGEVGSVLLLSRMPIDDLPGQMVALSSTSATGAALAQLVLQARFGSEVEFTPVAPDRRQGLLEDYPAVVLIGDDALWARSNNGVAATTDITSRSNADNGKPYCYDLGRLWKELTGEKMVFALWVSRHPRNQDDADRLRTVVAELMAARDRGLYSIERVVAEAVGEIPLAREVLRKYYNGLQYTLDPAGRRGLLRFYELAAGMGLCPPCTSLNTL